MAGSCSMDMDGGAKAAKKPKAAKAAKRKLTPYNKFVKKMFKELRSKFPDDTAPEIMKKIGVEWRKTKKD
jgi:hypothetical protein